MTKNVNEHDQSLSLYIGNFTLQIKHIKTRPTAQFILSYDGPTIYGAPPKEVSLGIASFDAQELEVIGVNLVAMASDMKRTEASE